jgi:glycosyltransferase involved in cell wall biosynthesis
VEPLVSIITASYNKVNFIKETILSVIQQSYSNWELLIIDDCSTDKTVAQVENLVNDKRIKLFKNESNRGANFCRNMGIDNAKGDYLIFLDADDILALDCLKNRVSTAIQNPEIQLFVFTMGVFYHKIGDSDQNWVPSSKDPLKGFLQHKLPWSILQPFWKADFLIHLNGFDESFKRLEDVELNTRALLDKDLKYKLVPGKPDCYYRIDEARKIFNTYEFLQRWVLSTRKYYFKFYDEANSLHIQNYLIGTINQTYLQMLLNYKLKKIDSEQMIELEMKLFKELPIGWLKKQILRLIRFYNLLPWRLPGVNFVLNKFLIGI